MINPQEAVKMLKQAHLTSKVLRIGAMCLGIGGAGFGIYQVVDHNSQPKQIATVEAQAGQGQGQEITIKDFVVAGGIKTTNRVLLNSETNFRSPSNVTLMIPQTSPLYAITDPVTLRGKKLKVTGIMGTYTGTDRITKQPYTTKQLVVTKLEVVG